MGLKGVTCTFGPGELVVVAGRNGSGKTVLMLHLNGLLSPTTGSVMFDGRPVDVQLARVRQKIGIVFQEPDDQIVGQTVWEEVAFGPENLALSETETAERVDAALAAVGIGRLRDHRPHFLSGGEKRRVALAGVLAMMPEFVVFDEPFAGLDLPGVRSVLGEILAVHEAGRTVIVLTHDLEKILAHATRLIVMEEGTIREDGPPAVVGPQAEQYGIRFPLWAQTDISGMSWLK